VRVEAQPEGEFSYRGAVAAYRSGYPEDQIHDALLTARRRRERGPRGWRQQAVEYLQRPLTGGRPQGRALAGPVVKTRGDRDDHPDMLVRGEPDDQFGVVARRAQRAPVRLSQRASRRSAKRRRLAGAGQV
jgi:hypothetical protein